MEQQISERDHERAKALDYLNLPVNHSMRTQSQYLNGLIQRKAFSWTSVFEDLERVVPPGLHVVSVAPEWNDQNQLLLQLKVSSNSRETALELVHRMENSTRFHDTQLVEENATGEGNAVIAAQIVAIYVPGQPERGTK